MTRRHRGAVRCTKNEYLTLATVLPLSGVPKSGGLPARWLG
jgi:hypothetical protein